MAAIERGKYQRGREDEETAQASAKAELLVDYDMLREDNLLVPLQSLQPSPHLVTKPTRTKPRLLRLFEPGPNESGG
jgi:hypothetical protein